MAQTVRHSVRGENEPNRVTAGIGERLREHFQFSRPVVQQEAQQLRWALCLQLPLPDGSVAPLVLQPTSRGPFGRRAV